MAERQAIANEIHDSLAQNLVYGRMRMSMLQEALRKNDELLAHKCLHDVNEALDSGQKSVRELITHFRCQMDPLGLQHALQVLVNDFCERTGIALEYSNRVTDPGLPLEHELQVYNIVREVLANIAAHSGATQARMLVSRRNGRYAIAIEDNGVGISGTLPEEGHYGLSIMRERAQRIGAEIEMESSKGLGTKVRLSFMAP
jgi:two-component system, NarL family, nitrate/nitrite sensor histidine kinase NarX